MKSWVKTSALGLSVAVILCLAARAQLNGLIQGALTPAQDSIVQITADAMGLEPVALEDLPRGGTFWWVEASGVMAPLPCPPLNRVVPIYIIADGQFLVDDTGGQVAVNTRRLNLTQATTSSLTVSAVDRLGNTVADLIEQIQETQFERTVMMSLGMDVPSPGEGGGGTNGGGGWYSNYQIPTTNDLWLEVIGTTNTGSGMNVTLLIHPPWNATNGVYDLFATTNLVPSAWQWVVRCNPGQTNLTMTGRSDQMEFYRLGLTTDTDGDGLTDAFENLVSHTDPNNLDTDGDGIPDGWSVMLNLDPLASMGSSSSTRSNYGYTSADWLNQVSGVRTGSINLDNEGNVLSVSQ